MHDVHPHAETKNVACVHHRLTERPAFVLCLLTLVLSLLNYPGLNELFRFFHSIVCFLLESDIVLSKLVCFFLHILAKNDCMT